MPKGYIYISSPGTDPEQKDNLNDPLFTRPPTLGACMPNIRRLVSPGDYIFVVSGMTSGVQQYVVGGMRVSEKIDALAAYDRFPENRLSVGPMGNLIGNIIVQEDGTQHPLDRHDPATFESRLENYIVGNRAITLQSPNEVSQGRRETLRKLAQILERPSANRVIDVMGRWSKLDDKQIGMMIDWLREIKAAAR